MTDNIHIPVAAGRGGQVAPSQLRNDQLVCLSYDSIISTLLGMNKSHLLYLTLYFGKKIKQEEKGRKKSKEKKRDFSHGTASHNDAA